MITKAQGVTGKYILTSILLMLALFNTNYGVAQDYKEFYKSINNRLQKYPQQLNDSCTITYTNLLIRVTSTGKIESLKISDSAPLLFKKAFTTIAPQLDIKPIELLIQQKNLKNCGIVIPLAYLLSSERCVIAYKELGNLIAHYNEYDSKSYEGPVYNLPPLVVTVFDSINRK